MRRGDLLSEREMQEPAYLTRLRANSRKRLDGFPAAPVGSRKDGGFLIPDGDRNDYDFARLESAVAALLDRHEQLRSENAKLRRELVEKKRRIRRLDEQVLEANQRRQDVGKHIDELIAQIDQLDAQFESQDEP
jgi:septal ring factor EnvC (AmiA/AmiB activator)